MRTKERIKAKSLVMVLCLMAIPVSVWPHQQSSSQQTGDPVADAARKARQEKKNAAKSKRVFTDDDLKPAIPEAPEKPAAGADAAAGAQKADGAEKANPNSEKAWRKRFAEQHAKIDKAQMELDVLQREQEKSQLQYYNDPQKALAEQNNRADISETNKNIDVKKKELARLQQELDDLVDELRKSGGDPAWAR